MPILHQLELFEKNLPYKPYCTDELGQVWIRPRSLAMKKLHIQPNPPDRTAHLVFDLDTPTARFDWIDRDCPAPSWLAVNKTNGHAHLGYTLGTPVTWSPTETKATRFLASVDIALSRKLGADPAYAKFLTKNPLRDDFWHVEFFQKLPYDLDGLASWLDLEPFEDKRKRLPAEGLGRNCTVFDRLRLWAYRAIRQEWLDRDFWIYQNEIQAHSYNDFPNPLDGLEVKSISKSVGNWVWENMSRNGFSAWQKRNNFKSQEVRKISAEEKREKVLSFAKENPGLSNRKIASIFGISSQSVDNYMKFKN